MNEGTRPPQSTESRDDSTGDSHSWKCHPVKRRPLISIAVTAFICMITIGVYYAAESLAFASLALIVLVASLARFYLPTQYQLTHDEIIVKSLTQTLRKKWSIYRTVYPDKNGVFISPFIGRSRLENFRGLYLMCPDDNDSVAEFARERIASAHSDGDNTAGES